jgi:hypothetical protein
MNLVYRLDLSKEKNWWRFLGTTKVLGYAEAFDKTQAPNNLRYQDQVADVFSPWLVGPSAAAPTATIRNNNNAKFLTRYYLGDANGGNVDYGSTSPNTSKNIDYRRYGSVAGEPLNTWYDVSAPIAPAYFSQGLQETQTTTRGFILQNYLVNDRVITTWGRRKDTLRTRDSGTSTSLSEPASASDPVTGLSTSTNWLYDFSFSPWNVVNPTSGARQAVGYTDNKGIVVKPFRWISLRYNQSTSFKPEAFGIDFQEKPLPNSGGKSKDYGFNLNLFHDTVIIGVTRFETFAKDSRTNDINTVARRITNFDYDLSATSNSVHYDLEDWLVGELQLAAGVATPTQAQTDAWTVQAHQLMGLTQERIDYTRLYNPSMTADRRARGYELSIDYNPNQFLSIKMNGSQTETIYTNFGKTWSDYVSERMPIWTTITSPYSGARYWDQVTFDAVTPAVTYQTTNRAPMQVNLALNGKPVPQLAKYRANLLGRYRLAGIFSNTPFVKDLTVGGKISWSDKTGLGFYGAAPEADGLVRDYDANRPVWYRPKSQVDMFLTYDFRLMSNRIKGSVQLNVRNVTENGHLQPYGANPDGSLYLYRIIDPREYILGVNFDL